MSVYQCVCEQCEYHRNDYQTISKIKIEYYSKTNLPFLIVWVQGNDSSWQLSALFVGEQVWHFLQKGWNENDGYPRLYFVQNILTTFF